MIPKQVTLTQAANDSEINAANFQAVGMAFRAAIATINNMMKSKSQVSLDAHLIIPICKAIGL